MRILTNLIVAVALVTPLPAAAWNWGCGDFGRDLRAAAEGGLSRAEAQRLLPSYEDLGKALRARASGSDAACVSKTLDAWNKLGKQLRGAPSKEARVVGALDRTRKVSHGCIPLD